MVKTTRSLAVITDSALSCTTTGASPARSLETHLRPSTRTSPPSEAGSAMIRADGRSGKRRKYDGGFTESPAPCTR